MALSACNVVSNPSFETGVLAPWRASAVNVATISNGTTAYSGDYYLNLQTAYGNSANSISQGIRHLKPHTEYKFSVQAQVVPSAVEFCGVFVSLGGRNATINIAAVDISNDGVWTEVTGSHIPKSENEILSIFASCDSEDSSNTGNVLFDDISLIADGCAYGLA
ncbi:unnamed protein product [Penicillium glandicola]